MAILALENDRPTLGETIANLRLEGRRRSVLMAAVFVIVGLGAVAVGWNWPKKFHTAATVLMSDDKIIQKLMEGRAVTTGVAERAMIAREIIFSRAVMDDVLKLGGWLSDAPSAAERELRSNAIQARTIVGSPRENLIRIQYTDSQPERAARVAQFFADRFIADSRAMQMRESKSAEAFIGTQVTLYADQLAAAQAALSDWLTAHPEARSEPGELMAANVALLRRRLEADQLQLQQLARGGEAIGAAAIDPMSMRIGELREEILIQEVDYTDAHPSLVRSRQQLAQLLERQAQTPPSVLPGAADRNAARDALAIGARISATEQSIAREIERVRSAADPSPAYAQLARERDVARDLYQDLLRRQEYARLSVRLDEQGSGLGFQIQEAAVVPRQASGLRFAHFVVGGALAATLIPLALLLLYIRADPRLRSAAALQRATGLAVIATAPMYWNAEDIAQHRQQRRLALWLVALTVLALVLASLWKLVGAS